MSNCFMCGVLFHVFVVSILNATRTIPREFSTKNNSDLESLVYVRREVKRSIEKYARKEEDRLIYLRERLKASQGFSQIKNAGNQDLALGEIQASTGNPINAFLLVKALTLDLSELITIAGDRENFREFAKTIEDLHAEINFPSGEDIDGAALGLIRLQDTYQLQTKEIANGAIEDSCCAPKLSVEDCFELGKQSYHSKQYDYAIEWLNEALTRMPNPLIKNDSFIDKNYGNFITNSTDSSSVVSADPNGLPPKRIPASKDLESEILDYLQWAKNIKKTMEGKDFLSQMTGVELDAFVDEVAHVMSGPKEKEKIAQKKLAFQYKSLCRGTNSSNGFENPKLKCIYSSKDTNPYYILGPLKKELINLNPPIWSFKEVIFDAEIEKLKILAKPKFETAMIVNVATGINERSDTRISKSAWLNEYDGLVVTKINQRIGHISGLTMDSAELLQIANYGIGGMYLPHYDFAQEGQSANFMINDGNRIATMLIYMSDVEKGGATVFPKLNLTVWPEKGSAILWHNLKRSGKGDLRTQHAACPVLVGSKWVSNKWIHERGQEFRYKCGLTEEE